MLFFKLKTNLFRATCIFVLPLKARCVMSYYNEVIIKEWLCFDLARHCINSYFEQTQWQQPADAKWYLSSIIYVFHSLSLALFLSFTPHTHLTLPTWLCTSTCTARDVRGFQEGAAQNCLSCQTETSTRKWLLPSFHVCFLV